MLVLGRVWSQNSCYRACIPSPVTAKTSLTDDWKIIQCKKGDTIAGFLEKARAEFSELRQTSVDNMMYIVGSAAFSRSHRPEISVTSAERGSYHSACAYFHLRSRLVILIKPNSQHYTFYDFIVSKARGKSGPLFNFDVHDDVRMTHDATVEKNESHAGKIVERSWYNRNKHVFPSSRWEMFDPEKK